MEIIRDLINLKSRHKGAVATIGNFDGVHLGHQLILNQVMERAKALGKQSMLICFEPQPKEYFDEFNAPARLTRFREKVSILDSLGLDLVFCMKFNEKTRGLSAQQFVDMLVNGIEISALFVGDDFHFGHDRSGGFDMLKQAGDTHGFEVTNQKTLKFEADRVSSTRIRESLAAGDFVEAEQMLGRPYFIMGKVVYGRQLGRTLDAATANIQLHRYRAPIDGVFAVEVEGLGRTYRGVANVGVRPTLNEATPRPILEVHLFDFDGSIYGKNVKVIFRHKIRAEKKFSGLDELKAAIMQDISDAEGYFREVDAEVGAAS